MVRRTAKDILAFDEAHGSTAFGKGIYLAGVCSGRPLGDLKTCDGHHTTPVILDNRIFCGSGIRRLYIGDIRVRKLIRGLDAGARTSASTKPVGDGVIFGTRGSKLIVMEVKSLAVKAIIQLLDAVASAVAISDDGRRVYISTVTNDLFAWERL